MLHTAAAVPRALGRADTKRRWSARRWKAVDFNTGRTVAWNEVNIAGYAKKDLARLVNEVKLLKTLKHGNLIRFFGIWDVPAKHKLVFITEFMDSGTIKE